MSHVAEKLARRRQLRNAAIVAVVFPALLAACAPAPAPPPPAPPQPVYAPASASASGSGCPRLTGGAVRLKGPILELLTK